MVIVGTGVEGVLLGLEGVLYQLRKEGRRWWCGHRRHGSGQGLWGIAGPYTKPRGKEPDDVVALEGGPGPSSPMCCPTTSFPRGEGFVLRVSVPEVQD